jgi:hypothetical protein
MWSPEDTAYGTNGSGSLMRAARAASRRELLRSKQRSRQTDLLPDIDDETGTEHITGTQTDTPREENRRLRRELETLQEQLESYRMSIGLLDSEIETIHHAHQQEIEQYQQHLRDMMDERNQMQETNQQLEARYQDLYHSFQDAVEEEARKMVQEAAQTLILSPEHTPPLLSDVVQTLEQRTRQTEDQRTMEQLALLRQAQYKSEQLELEVARERAELDAERENLRVQRENCSTESQQRYKMERSRLRVRWSAGLTFVCWSLFTLMVVLEGIFYQMQLALALVVFVPLALCLLLSYVFAHLYTSGRISVQFKTAQKKAPAKAKGAKPASAGQTKSAAKTR